MSDEESSDRSDRSDRSDTSDTSAQEPESTHKQFEDAETAQRVSQPRHRASWTRRHWGFLLLLTILFVPSLAFGAWAWITLNYSYSKGDRAGYIQKISRKGWLCKTWEGELAMANLPGAMPEIFHFSVRNDSIAALIDEDVGKRVSLTYEEHRGVPTSCFAETNYYITNVRLIDS